MSRTVNYCIYDQANLISSILNSQKSRNMDKNNIEFINQILEKFGTLKNGLFITINNEYTDDYDNLYECIIFLERFFGILDASDFFTESQVDYDKWIYLANADDVASELNVKLLEAED